ncbi:MAG: ribonuclease Z [Candidatus Marsarchaeota archaeon]|nr:ribonuclease Z [Candidatus Marsarchaeota archaeon]
MFTATFLGTSGSAPTKQRGLSSVALEHNGETMLFDCGEGTQRQMQLFGVNISKVNHIFITHMHADHVLGIAGLIRTMSLYHRTSPLTIYFPEGYMPSLESLIKFDNALMAFDIILKGVKSGTVLEGNGFAVKAFKLKHSIKCYGYAFAESDKVKFLKNKCNSLGIKGKMFSELSKKGYITVSGKRIRISEVTTREPGKKFVYATDTRPLASTAIAAKNADVFVHETTYDSSLAKQARERQHSTSEEAAQIAKKANVKQFVLYHFSTRYKDTSTLLEEARRTFKNSVASYDGLKISVK